MTGLDLLTRLSRLRAVPLILLPFLAFLVSPVGAATYGSFPVHTPPGGFTLLAQSDPGPPDTHPDTNGDAEPRGPIDKPAVEPVGPREPKTTGPQPSPLPAVPGPTPAPAQQTAPPLQQQAPVQQPVPLPAPRPALPGPAAPLPPGQTPQPPGAVPLGQQPQKSTGEQGTPGLPSPSLGSQQATQQPRPAQPLRQTATPKRPSSSRGSISLNFDDADVYQVIQTIFGDVLKVNYIVDPRVKGRVTFRSVAPIAGDQVLPLMEVILRINGIGVVEDNGLYRIVPISEIAREPATVGSGRDPEKVPATGKSVVQVIPILYLQSSEMIKLITPFLSANAVIIDVPKTNQIIVVDTDASVRRALQLVSEFDNEQQRKKQAQVYVYPVQNGKAKNVANLLQQIFLGARTTPSPSAGPDRTTATSPGTPKPATPQPATSPARTPQQSLGQQSTGTGESLVSDITKIFGDDVTNSVIILATPEDYQIIRETIEKIDIVPRQVMIEGMVAAVDLTDDLNLGLAWAFKTNLTFFTDVKGTVGFNTGTLSAANVPTSGFTFVGKVGDDIRVVIDALASRSKAKVIAAPHILVSDNREARIQIGEQVPLVTSETYGSTTVAPQRTIQYKDTGIILKVTPQVNEGGLVSLDLSQEISRAVERTLFTNEINYIIQKTEASTNVVVADGETIVIGGLIQENTSRSLSGLPLLSRLPLIGHLFGDTNNTYKRTETIILLTPRVIMNQKEARTLTGDYVDRITRTGKGKLTRDELLKKPGDVKPGSKEQQPKGSQEPPQVQPSPDVPF